jgi:arginyl-tRNA synthetase
MKAGLIQVFEDVVQTYLKNEGQEPHLSVSIELETPQEERHGDLSCNVAMKLSGLLKRPPVEIAEALVKALRAARPLQRWFSKIDLAPPGFINFYFSSEWIGEQVAVILKTKTAYGKNEIGHGKKWNVEFISVNPTGPLHVGHGRGAGFGDVLANVLAFSGFTVNREYYLNDRGVQIDKLGESVTRRFMELQGVHMPYPEDCYQGDYVIELAKKIDIQDVKLTHPSRAAELKEEIKEQALSMLIGDIQRMVKEKLNINFDEWFSERSLYEGSDISQALAKLETDGLMYKQDGATWMKTTALGDDKDRVLLKSNGEESYFVSDVAHLWNRLRVKKYDHLIIVLGADHHGYVGRLKAIEQALTGRSDVLDISLAQLVKFVENGKEVKMSKRAGTFIELEELVDEFGIDVVRFFFLMSSMNTHMDFDLTLAQERSEKNPVFYVQYAHARIASILRNLSEEARKVPEPMKFSHPAEQSLAKELLRFPAFVERIAETYEVHQLTIYTTEVARRFHDFYQKCRVIEDDTVHLERVALIQATQIVLRQSLHLMGISAPEKM